MNKHERILIVREEGACIYGRVIDSRGKMGLYEVFSDYWGSNGTTYHNYMDAERRMKEVVSRTKKDKQNE